MLSRSYGLMVNYLGGPWLWLGVLCQFTGCVFEGRESLPDWKGLHQYELLTIMGEPADRVPLSGGREQLIFDQGRLQHHMGTHDSWACRMFFELDSEGFVQRVSTSGC